LQNELKELAEDQSQTSNLLLANQKHELDVARASIEELTNQKNAKNIEIEKARASIEQLTNENKEIKEAIALLTENAQHSSEENVQNTSFIPQSDLVKLLLNDLQKEADEVLDLVLNYPDLHETHSAENIQDLQNIWAKEKEALLGVIKSLKDFISNTSTQQLNFTIATEGLDEGLSSNTHEKRSELINLVKTIFDKEQEALLAEIESLNTCHANELPNISTRKHVEASNKLLTELESKDREQLIDEISLLRRSVDNVDSKIDQLNQQITTKESVNEQNQNTLLKLYKDIEESQAKRNELQQGLQSEKSKNYELSRQFSEANIKIEALQNQLENDRLELLTQQKERFNENGKINNEETIMKLHQQVEKEKNINQGISKKLRVSLDDQADLSKQLSEARDKIEALHNELNSDRSNYNNDRADQLEKMEEENEGNKEIILKLYQQIEDGVTKNRELKEKLHSAATEKMQMSSKHVESDTLSDKEKLFEEKQEKNQETILKLYQIVENEQIKNKELKKTLQSLSNENSNFAKQLTEANEIIETLHNVIDTERNEFNGEVTNKESLYEDKLNESQEKLLKLYKMIDSEQAKRKDMQKQLSNEKTDGLKLKKKLSDLAKENQFLENQLADGNHQVLSEKKQLEVKISEEHEKLEYIEQKLFSTENERLLLENNLKNEKDNFQNQLLKENKLKQKTDEIITLLEGEQNKRVDLEELLERTNHLLQIERKKVEELNQLVLHDNNNLKKKEEKLEILMSQLEHENQILRDRQFSQENIEREIFAKKNEIESIEYKMKQEKMISEKESKKLQNLLDNLQQVEGEKQKLANSLLESKTYTQAIKKQLKEKINELEEIQEKRNENEVELKNTVKDLQGRLKDKTGNEVSDDGRKLLNAGWTIAKVQRLYLKYFRAESFRKALAYQKRYLLLLLSDYQQNEESVLAFIAKLKSPAVGEKKRPNVAKRRFKVAVNAIIAINRLKFLTRKYQRNLHKSSPEYLYKDKSLKMKDIVKLPMVEEEQVAHSKTRPQKQSTRPSRELSHGAIQQKVQHKRRSSPDKRIKTQKKIVGEASTDNSVNSGTSKDALPTVILSSADEKDSNASSKDGTTVKVYIKNTSKRVPSDERKETYSPPTRLNNTGHPVSLSIPPNSGGSIPRSPRTPPRSYPRPKNLSLDDNSKNSLDRTKNICKQSSAPPEIKQDSSLNNYIAKLENLQERLKEQSKNVGKKRPSLL